VLRLGHRHELDEGLGFLPERGQPVDGNRLPSVTRRLGASSLRGLPKPPRPLVVRAQPPRGDLALSKVASPILGAHVIPQIVTREPATKFPAAKANAARLIAAVDFQRPPVIRASVFAAAEVPTAEEVPVSVL
jgi:hypothetical protein